MSQQELVKKVVSVLDRAGIPYMLTGSIASSLQGEPRSTHDVDLVVLIDETNAPVLAEAFPAPDYYLEEESILDAVKHRSMFNLIDTTGGEKADFWLLTEQPFDQSRFSRKYSEEFLGVKIQVSSPEDTILAKLRWAKLSGGSEKQFTDALRVYEVKQDELDQDYLEHWTQELDVETLWRRLINEAEIV